MPLHEHDTDDTVDAGEDFTPAAATTHVSVVDRTEPVILGPIATEPRGVWPLAPWRWVLIVTATGIAATCGIPAAAPVWNGADLAILICLATFVAAFTPGRD